MRDSQTPAPGPGAPSSPFEARPAAVHTAEGSSEHAAPRPDEAAALHPGAVRVVYTDTLPDGVYVVYRGGPPRLLVNEGWWRRARPVERIQALESLWARLESIPAESWDSLEAE